MYGINIIEVLLILMLRVTLPFRRCTVNGQEFRAYPDGRLERRVNNDWQLIDVKPNNTGYRRVKANSKNYLYHRIIYQAFNPTWDITDQTSLIDHIDRNPLNNAVDNLRIATKAENGMNRIGNTNRKYIGLPKNIYPVYRSKRNKWDWRIRIEVDGKAKAKYIFAGDGRIPDPLPPLPADVIKARNDFVKLHHGEFAN